MNPIGSVADFISRIYKRFPSGWVGSPVNAPVFYALMTGLATAHANFYELVQFAGQMVYLQSSTGGWIDTWAYDFFGSFLLRNSGETDFSFINRMKSLLFAPTCTRDAIATAVQNISGLTPVLVEPWRGPDTFALNVDTFALGVAGAGRLGSLNLPFQAFVYLPGVSGQESGMPLGVQPFALGVTGSGNYLESQSQNSTIEDLLSAINYVRPIGTTVFVNFA